ncbi:MAG: ribbon-helix-helix protein, CopG family [Candidatus Dadabacteria bacterium]|nr:ribbon-helix-helix protein, CopG family [Candidatus Dadabacteria bacterium]
MEKRTDTKRTTVYLDAKLARELRLIAAGNDTSVSALINEAVRDCLAEDVDDYAVSRKREREKAIPFDEVVKDLKKRGKI